MCPVALDMEPTWTITTNVGSHVYVILTDGDDADEFVGVAASPLDALQAIETIAGRTAPKHKPLALTLHVNEGDNDYVYADNRRYFIQKTHVWSGRYGYSNQPTVPCEQEMRGGDPLGAF